MEKKEVQDRAWSRRMAERKRGDQGEHSIRPASLAVTITTAAELLSNLISPVRAWPDVPAADVAPSCLLVGAVTISWTSLFTHKNSDLQPQRWRPVQPSSFFPGRIMGCSHSPYPELNLCDHICSVRCCNSVGAVHMSDLLFATASP
jgi:hypothetical protein